MPAACKPRRTRQSTALLSALLAASTEWRHGLALARETGLKPGTIYPILIRLEEQGFLDARWEPPTQPGRPPRHLYRLTAAGRVFSREWTAEADTAPHGQAALA